MILFACYGYEGRLEDPVISAKLRPLNVASYTQEIALQYLLKEERGEEVRREYYNNNNALKVELSIPYVLGSRLQVYVIARIFVIDGRTLEVEE